MARNGRKNEARVQHLASDRGSSPKDEVHAGGAASAGDRWEERLHRVEVALESQIAAISRMAADHAEFKAQFAAQFQSRAKDQGDSVPSRNPVLDLDGYRGLQAEILEPNLNVFEGTEEEVIPWINQAIRMFEYHNTDKEDWVKICGFYLGKRAFHWYEWGKIYVEGFLEWDVFKKEMISRFGPAEMEMPFNSFCNLKQVGTVRDFLTKFEQLMGFLEKLPMEYTLEKFVGGLKDDIRFDVVAAEPKSFEDALFLACNFEELLIQLKKDGRSKYGANWNG